MAYLGNRPAEAYSAFQKQDFSTSATTSYTLDHPVANQNEIALFINFVRQEPTAAYTASGTTLTLTSATSSSDDMYCIYLGKAVQTVNPPSGSVGTSQLASEAVTNAKVASSIITGQTAETSIATDDLILLSDTSASGALKKMTRANFVSGVGGNMTPAFEATVGSQQSITQSSYTKVIYATESFDTDGVYDASAGRFTPTTSAKYFVYATAKITWGGGAGNGQYLALYKNGSLHRAAGIDGQTVDSHSVFAAITLNGSSDYVELYAYSGSNFANIPNETNRCVFGAYKIIE